MTASLPHSPDLRRLAEALKAGSERSDLDGQPYGPRWLAGEALEIMAARMEAATEQKPWFAGLAEGAARALRAEARGFSGLVRFGELDGRPYGVEHEAETALMALADELTRLGVCPAEPAPAPVARGRSRSTGVR